MTLDEAKQLEYGQIIYHAFARNADGSPQRWRVAGTIKTWKRDPDRVEIKVRHGMHDHDLLDQWNLPLFYVSEDEAEVAGQAFRSRDYHARAAERE